MCVKNYAYEVAEHSIHTITWQNVSASANTLQYCLYSYKQYWKVYKSPVQSMPRAYSFRTIAAPFEHEVKELKHYNDILRFERGRSVKRGFEDGELTIWYAWLADRCKIQVRHQIRPKQWKLSRKIQRTYINHRGRIQPLETKWRRHEQTEANQQTSCREWK